MKTILFASALLFSVAGFAGEVDLIPSPAEPVLQLTNKDNLVAPWFAVDFAIYNDHGLDVVLTHIQLDISSDDGFFESRAYSWKAPYELSANGQASMKNIFVDKLPPSSSGQYGVVAHLKGWFGNKNKVEEPFEVTRTFIVK